VQRSIKCEALCWRLDHA